MVFTLLSHQWKAFWRGRSAGKNLATQIFIGILCLYLLGCALLLGISLQHALKGLFPGQDTVRVFCGLILYYFSADILMRFIFQELPILSVQPYLTQNIRRRQLVNFLNLRSIFHFLNLLPPFIFIPFTVTAIASAYGALTATAFIISIFSITLFNHFLILYIKRKTIINSWWLPGFLGIIAAFVALDYFHIFSFRSLSAALFTRLLSTPWLCLIFIVLAIISFWNNARFLHRHLYFEEISRRGGRQKQSTEYSWLQQWGLSGELIALDIKLMLRNKRPKYVLISSLIFLLYGFIFYKPQYLHPNMYGMLLFGAMFITGIFIMNYGQFLFAWHSSSFDGLMASNISMATFIRSKFMLFTAVSTICFILSSFYGLISWKVLPIQLATYLYNIGINAVLAVYFATRSYKGIDLTRSATFNYQGTGMAQWLYALVIMVVPILIYWLVAKLTTPWIAFSVLGTLGLISLLLQNWWIGLITKEFGKRKYLILEGFREK